MASLDLPLFYCFQDGVNQRFSSLREWNLADDERLGVQFLNLRTYLQYASALSVVVFRDIYRTTRREVGIQVELLIVQIADGSIADLHEVMRQDF